MTQTERRRFLLSRLLAEAPEYRQLAVPDDAAERYSEFLRRHEGQKILFLELGVGGNTPVIIKYPFWRMTARNPNATYVCINKGEAVCPNEIAKQSLLFDGDIAAVLAQIK